MGEAALQGLRRLDEAAQGLGTLGQRCGFGERRKPAPVHGRTFIRGGVDIVAQGRAEGRFIALRDRDLVYEGRPEVAAADLE